MLPTMRSAASSQDRPACGNSPASPTPPSDPISSPVLVVCFVFAPQQAQSLVAMLQSIAVNSPNNSVLGTLPETPVQESKPTWLTHSEAARYLGVAMSTLYRYAEQERIECRKIANRLEYRRSSLDSFKENQIRPARRSRSRGTIVPTLGSGN